MMHWFRRLMYGRNGMDTLANVCLIAGLVVYIVAAIFDLFWISLLFSFSFSRSFLINPLISIYFLYFIP